MMQAAAAGPNPLTSFVVPMALIFLVFYFVIMLPAKREQRKKQSMLDALKKGDRVVTHGGIFGTIVSLGDQDCQLRLSEGVKVRVLRSAIAGPEGDDQASA